MLTIRPYQPADSAAVPALILPIQREEFGIPVTLAEQGDLLDIPGFYQQGAGNFWLALANGEVVGSIALRDIGAGQAALRKMFVAAPWRGRLADGQAGVAQQLLQTLLDWAQAQGLQQIFLGTTAQFQAAHRFYEKNGFVQIAASALPQSFPRMRVDTRFYCYEVAGASR